MIDISKNKIMKILFERFYSYWSTIDISKIMKILLLERLWTILIDLRLIFYFEN